MRSESRKRNTKWIFVFLFMLSNIALAETPIYTIEKTTIVISHDQPEFIIKLKANPTTGYTWILREYDKNQLELVKHEFVRGPSQLVGAPGYDFWTFHAKPDFFTQSQQTTIRLTYMRPWEPITTNTKDVVFVITK